MMMIAMVMMITTIIISNFIFKRVSNVAEDFFWNYSNDDYDDGGDGGYDDNDDFDDDDDGDN